jgi:hypothetical protein
MAGQDLQEVRCRLALIAGDPADGDDGDPRVQAGDIDHPQAADPQLFPHAADRHERDAEPGLDQPFLGGEAVDRGDRGVHRAGPRQPVFEEAAEGARAAAFRREAKPRLVPQRAQVRQFAGGDPVRGRHHDVELLVTERDRLQLGVGIGVVAQPEVRLATANERAHLAAGRGAQIDRHLGPRRELAQRVDDV